MSINNMLVSGIVQLATNPTNCNKYMGEQFLFVYNNHVIFRDVFKKTNTSDNYLRLLHTDPETTYKALALYNTESLKDFLISLIPFVNQNVLPNLTNALNHLS